MSSPHHITLFRNWLLASPPAEWMIMQLRELLIGSLRQGPVPKHVAFVMDGNRRYARSRRIETVEGHHLGFEALARILEVCYKSGVKVVTIYAFSIENFKRSRYEVDALMEMAKVKLSQLAEHGALLDRYGASVRVLGQRDLVRPDVLESIDRAVEITSQNRNAVLNVCFPYTSRDEITTAIRETVADYSKPIERSDSSSSRIPFSHTHIEHKIRSQQRSSSNSPERQNVYETPSNSPPRNLRSPSASSTTSDSVVTGPYEPSNHESLTSSTTTLNHDHDHSLAETIPPFKSPSPTSNPTNANTTHAIDPQTPGPTYRSPELITPSTLTAHTFTATNPPLDILIRTSGVERLSDFMLWQCHQDTEIVFLKTLWPEFDLWGFLPVIWEWQYKQRRRGNSKKQQDSDMQVGSDNAPTKPVRVVASSELETLSAAEVDARAEEELKVE